jgi:hypothetical protein
MDRPGAMKANLLLRKWYLVGCVIIALLNFFTGNLVGQKVAAAIPALASLADPILFSAILLVVFAAVVVLLAVRAASTPKPLLVPANRDAAVVAERTFEMWNQPGIAARISTLFGTDGPLLDSNAYPFIQIQFSNEPYVHGPAAEAKGVQATVEYWNNGQKLMALDGRWAHTPEPTQVPFGRSISVPTRGAKIAPSQASVQELLKTDFPVGEPRQLDIAFKDVANGACYAFNNDSYLVGLKNQRFKLSGDVITVKIKLSGLNTDSNFEFKFRDMGTGKGLEIVQQP